MDEPHRIYIAGPMTGLPEHNFPAFHAAAKRLREAGWEAVNPAENFGGRRDMSRDTYLRADITLLATCEAMALLPGWEGSRGAMLEYLIAWELGLPVFDAVTLERVGPHLPLPSVNLHRLAVVADEADETPESVLDEAKRLTAEDRQHDYGPPSQACARTALMWTALLADRLREGQHVTATDVPLCMIAIKLARQAHRRKRDNLVDIAGYARTAAMVAGEE